jgi:uncharacterized protein (TIGR03437 family)
MRKAHRFVVPGLILAWRMFGVGAGAPLSGPEAMPSPPGSLVSKALEQLALSFEANDGQSEAGVRFLARGRGYGLFLTSTGAVLTLGRDAQGTRPILQWRFVGTNHDPDVTGLDPLAARSNYFIGPDPAKWRTNVPRYARVWYRNLYPGVDLVYHAQRGALEYDFVVAPGASFRVIEWTIEGARRFRLDRQGDLVLEVPGGQIRQRQPVVYQETAGGRQSVKGRFVVRGRSRVGFEVGPYDATRPLVIDPVLEYATYVGGDGSDTTAAVAVDSAGNAYVTGHAEGNFPTANAFQGSPPSAWTAFVLKLNAEGTTLVYSTYLGGEASTTINGIAVNSAGNAYVTGFTTSQRFPTVNAFQSSHGGGEFDAFVAKLDSTGSRLVYSTYVGGSQAEYANSIAVDGAGNAYVTGETRSDNFPTKNPLQAKRGPGTCVQVSAYPCPDAFVTKLDPSGSALVYSTYLGGSRTTTTSTQYENGLDVGYGITVDAAGNAYVIGQTVSADFPTQNALQAKKAGGLDTRDAFVTKLNPAGSALVYSTYLGGTGSDYGRAITVDSSSSIYVSGYTMSTDFPTAKPFQAAIGGGRYDEDAFVAKLNPSGSALLYSTYLGGSGNDEGRGIAVDEAGNAYVTGSTSSTDFPLAQPLQSVNGGRSDAFVSVLNASGSALLFSTYLGGSAGDSGSGIALDPWGSAYVAGSTASANFPSTPAAFQPKHGGGGNEVYPNSDAFVAKLTDLAQPPPAVAAMSAASFSTTALAPESIASAFGPNLATETKVADTVPLPTSLGGSTLTVTDSEGTERRAPLFFVSPGQINFLVPPGTKNGKAQLKITSASGPAVTGTVLIETVAPGLFSANADARGVAAGIVTIARADGTQGSELIFRDDAAQHKRVAAPMNLGSAGDTAVLTLFGTGIRFRSDVSAVKVTIGGQECEVLYAGPQGEFAGLDQVNVRLSRSLKGRDELEIMLTMEGKRANTVTIFFSGKPRITSVAPTSVRVGESVNLTVNGTDLEDVDRIEFSPAAGISVSNLRATAKSVTAQVAAAANAATGDRRLSVTGMVRSPDTAAFAVRPRPSSTPFIYNVSVTNDLLALQTAVFSGEFEFDDADGDIFYTGTAATSAKIEYRISGACTLTFTGGYLNQRGATSGWVHFLVEYHASRLVTSSSPSEFRLIDAAGNKSNVVLSEFGGYCP